LIHGAICDFSVSLSEIDFSTWLEILRRCAAASGGRDARQQQVPHLQGAGGVVKRTVVAVVN
jgi:hypothetical protein